MRRRSRAGGDPAKAQRRKTGARKSGIAPKARPHNPSAAREETEVERLTRELKKALEQQTAMSEVLRVISQSKFELQSVLQSVAETAARLCRSDGAVIFQLEGGIYRFAAGYSLAPAFLKIERQTLISPGPGTVVGRAAMTRRVARIDDALADPLYEKKEDAKVEGNRSMIGVPVLRDGQPVVVIGLGRRRFDPFGKREIELATTFAAQALIAIENARLVSDLRDSLQQQTATADVLKVISGSIFDLQTVLDTLVESAARLCNAERTLIYRPKDGSFHHAASYGYPKEFREFMSKSPLQPGRGSVVGRTALEKTVIQVTDTLADPEFTFVRPPNLRPSRTLLGVPLIREGTLIGAMGLARPEVKPFNAKEIELATTFADQAVIAIENTRLFEAEQQRTRELTESLEQQTATSKVLHRATDCYRRRPQNHQPVDFRFADSAANPRGISSSILPCRQGEHYSREKWGLLCRRGLWLLPRVSGVYKKYSDQGRAGDGVRASTSRRPSSSHCRRRR
jgi:GAF domain-containing protein